MEISANIWEHNKKCGVIFPGEIDKKAENTLKTKKHC